MHILNFKLDLPEFLKTNFRVGKIHSVRIDNLYVGLVSTTGGKTRYVKIYKTPHYFFAKNKITKNKEDISINECNDYSHYTAINYSSNKLSKKNNFLNLINSIKLSGYNFEESPIFVFRSWRRPLPLARWDVADGFHRLAVLAALNKKNKKIKVVSLRPKRNLVQRVTRFVKNQL